MHYDWAELNAASRRLEERLHNLDDKVAGSYAGRGLFGSYQMLGFDDGLANWLRFRTDVITGTIKTLKGLMREQRGDLQLGIGPRSAVFTPLCGYDLPKLAPYADYLHPKHYFWHRGTDGLYGTVYRWLTTLRSWNPSLSARGAFQVIEMLLGVRLPGVESELDFERGFPDAFFSEIVGPPRGRCWRPPNVPSRWCPGWMSGGGPMAATRWARATLFVFSKRHGRPG